MASKSLNTKSKNSPRSHSTGSVSNSTISAKSATDDSSYTKGTNVDYGIRKYLADILTSSRFILAIALLILAFVGDHTNHHFIALLTDNAFVIFLIAEITDIFDGTCARKWPFPKNHIPKYRKYAPLADMISDALLAAAQVLFVTLQLDPIAGGIIIFFYVVICGSIEMVVYGELFGHPDHCKPWSLAYRNFPLAKKIILVRRVCYALCLGITNAIILFGTSWPIGVKIALFILGCSICVFSWFFLRQRRKNISRNAVQLEQKLTQKAEKQHKH